MTSESEKKYGIVEDDSVKEFHRSWRMFCIYEGRLCIARANLPYSHYTWFENEGWLHFWCGEVFVEADLMKEGKFIVLEGINGCGNGT